MYNVYTCIVLQCTRVYFIVNIHVASTVPYMYIMYFTDFDFFILSSYCITHVHVLRVHVLHVHVHVLHIHVHVVHVHVLHVVLF